MAVSSPRAGSSRRGMLANHTHLAVGSDGIAEECSLAEDHLEAARRGVHRHAGCVAAGVDQAGIGWAGRGGIDDPPEGGVHAVAADEQVAGGLRAIREHRAYRVAGVLGVDQALAVLDADAAAGCLLVKRLVEVGALEGLAGHAPRQPSGAGAALGLVWGLVRGN